MIDATAETGIVAVVLGLSLAGGFALALSRVPRWGAPSLSRRIAPYLRDVLDDLDVPMVRPRAAVRVAMTDVARAVFGRAGGFVAGEETLARRLRQAGREVDVAAFRARQLVWTAGGVAVGAISSVGLALAGAHGPAPWVMPALTAGSAAILGDLTLARAAQRRVTRIQEELPTVLEFLALCLSAGEGILDALRRVGDTGTGDLSREVRAVVVDVGTGTSLPTALVGLARDLDLPALSRAVDQLVAAIERGAPLAQVLHSQASDAREEAKRTLIEQAGRREIWMLIPLVFLILPLSVLFAVYPGIFMLRLGLG